MGIGVNADRALEVGLLSDSAEETDLEQQVVEQPFEVAG